jgi:hypothetical protein
MVDAIGIVSFMVCSLLFTIQLVCIDSFDFIAFNLCRNCIIRLLLKCHWHKNARSAFKTETNHGVSILHKIAVLHNIARLFKKCRNSHLNHIYEGCTSKTN